MSVSVLRQPVSNPKSAIASTKIKYELFNAKEGKTEQTGSDLNGLTKQGIIPEPLNLMSASKVFDITFNYLGQHFHTKVLKINHHNGQPLYKVVLTSKMKESANICWLQKGLENWAFLLGGDINELLKNSISTAIEEKEKTGL